MKNLYTAAIVGLGNIAWKFNYNQQEEISLTHAKALQKNSNIKIIAGCSPVKSDRDEFEKLFEIETFDSIDNMIQSQKPDIVSVCSPSENHYEHLKKCFENNISMIWLEKPPCESLSALEELINIQEHSDLKSKVLVNYHRRYMEPYINLRKMYHEQKLGKCLNIQGTYSRGLETNGSHVIDTIFNIVDSGDEYVIDWVSSDNSEECPTFGISFDSGLKVIIIGLNLPYHCIDISLICENGRASVINGGMDTKVEKKVEHELYKNFYRLKSSENNFLGFGGIGNSMDDALENLISGFENDTPIKSNLNSAYKTQNLIENVLIKRILA